MSYTVSDVNTEDINELNRLVAEHIMEESEPVTRNHKEGHMHPIYSKFGAWVCFPEYEENDVCIWKPLDFCRSLKHCWQVVQKMNMGIPMRKEIFHFYLDKFFPLGASSEQDCCTAICRAALLAKIT